MRVYQNGFDQRRSENVGSVNCRNERGAANHETSYAIFESHLSTIHYVKLCAEHHVSQGQRNSQTFFFEL